MKQKFTVLLILLTQTESDSSTVWQIGKEFLITSDKCKIIQVAL